MPVLQVCAVGALAGAMLLSAPVAHAAKVKTIYRFKGGADGANPYAAPIYDKGFLYGTTYKGGAYGGGTVFKIDLAADIETVLYSFGAQKTGPLNPTANLTVKGNTLIGTTQNDNNGDENNDSAVFRLNIQTGAEAILDSLAGPPVAPFIPPNLTYALGAVYGTTETGFGTIYKLNPRTGAITTLHRFQEDADGAAPSSTLIETGGLLYGTAWAGGILNSGVFFRIDPATGAETVLYQFGKGTNSACPLGPIALHAGIFYGATQGCGDNGAASVYAINPATGAESVLSSGGGPSGVSYHAGRLYVTTASGISRIDVKTGTQTVIAKLPAPVPGLTLANGRFFGATTTGGTFGAGTVFELTP